MLIMLGTIGGSMSGRMPSPEQKSSGCFEANVTSSYFVRAHTLFFSS